MGVHVFTQFISCGFRTAHRPSGWNCTAMDKASRCAVFAIFHLQNVSSQALQVRHPKRANCFRSKLEQEPWSGSSQYSLLRGKLEENENYNGSGGVTLVLSHPVPFHKHSQHVRSKSLGVTLRHIHSSISSIINISFITLIRMLKLNPDGHVGRNKSCIDENKMLWTVSPHPTYTCQSLQTL